MLFVRKNNEHPDRWTTTGAPVQVLETDTQTSKRQEGGNGCGASRIQQNKHTAKKKKERGKSNKAYLKVLIET